MAQYQPAQQPGTRTVVPWGGIVATSGAVVLAVALFLPWRSLTIEFLGQSVTGSTNGAEQWEGVIATLAALAGVILGILSMTLRAGATRKWMGIALMSVGGLGFLVSIIALFRNVDTLGYGLLFAVVGALLISGGGVLAFLEARRLPAGLAPRYGQGYPQQQYQQPASPPQGYQPAPEQPPGYPPQQRPPDQPPAG
jgi:hypothetical protein